ncbi:hypothetical protein U9M48_015013 [Paspalum notatum var. saurae]|uniref:Uncharacterized protein n=1 Tax=Paspalum notatum var. saurae TaxID=547442 RepID=A0AAQ3T2B6_PASNO
MTRDTRNASWYCQEMFWLSFSCYSIGLCVVYQKYYLKMGDYEIDVDMLIRLWMTNSFILEKQGACLEFTKHSAP